MAGTFSKSARPLRPGAYFNFRAAEQQPVLESTSGVVAIPFVSDWGPEKQVVEVFSLGDFLAKFGGASVDGSAYSDGYKAVLGAFQGEGLPGRGGASSVLCYRMVASDGAAATHNLSNGSVTALTVEARYPGTFGNRLKVAVEDTPGQTGYNDLVVYDGTVELERFTHAATDITALAADILANSNWIGYSGTPVSGTALSDVSATSLSGGDDGDTIVQGDYTAAATAFEAFRFSLFAPANLTDDTTLAGLVAWIKSINERGKRVMGVFGGASDDDATTAVARSAAMNDPNCVNVGIGSYSDERLGTLSTAQLAPRIAGIIGRMGDRENLTFARLAGLSIVSGASHDDILDAITGGVVTMAKDSHPFAPVRVEKGVTSWTTTGDADRPYNIYSVPKFVRTVHLLEMELTEWAEINIIGRVAVTQATRELVRASMAARMAVREASGVIQPGWAVQIDPDPAPQPTDDFVALLYSFRFARSLEQILNTVVVG